jgi:hypothetical protein
VGERIVDEREFRGGETGLIPVQLRRPSASRRHGKKPDKAGTLKGQPASHGNSRVSRKPGPRSTDGAYSAVEVEPFSRRRPPATSAAPAPKMAIGLTHESPEPMPAPVAGSS